MRLDGELEAMAVRQHGCIAIWQLRALGARAKEITRLRRSQHWRAVSRRVLVRTGTAPTPQQAACAAVLEAGSAAWLASYSGAAWWRLGASYRLLPACVMTDHVTSSFTGDVGRIQPRRNVPDRWMTVLDGIPVVRPELCIYQLCGQVHPLRAERALDTGLSKGLVTIPSMQMCLDEVRRRGRDGTTVLEGLLRVRPIDFVPVATGLESRFEQIIGSGWRRQVDLGGESWAGRVDFRHEVHPVICEVLSERYHAALSFRHDDAIRRAKLEAAGFVVVEVWDRQVWHAPDEVQSIVKPALLAVQTGQNCPAGTARTA